MGLFQMLNQKQIFCKELKKVKLVIKKKDLNIYIYYLPLNFWNTKNVFLLRAQKKTKFFFQYFVYNLRNHYQIILTRMRKVYLAVLEKQFDSKQAC